MALKAVLFDFGNTLVSTRLDFSRILPISLSGLQQALRRHLPRLDQNRLGRDFLFLRKAGQKQAEAELVEVPAVLSLSKALALQGLTQVPQEVIQAGVDGFFAAEEAAYPVIFGIPETLGKLKQMGLRLAVVSNATCGKLIHRALERRRMLGLFDQVMVSAELGRRKPDPAIFREAMLALLAQPDECAVVGDQLEVDLEGARRAGMRGVLANFFGDAPEGSPAALQPDAVARHPKDLVELFRSWMG